MMRIVVGSASVLKLDAVHAALEMLGLEADVVSIDATSGIPPQPYGRTQTLEGAEHRAREARAAGKGTYAIGIENGLVPCREHVIDVAFVVVFTPDGRRLARRSIGVPVPQELVDAALASKQRKTAGSLEAERSGCSAADPHVIWSRGQTSRKAILTRAVYAALLPATLNEQGVE